MIDTIALQAKHDYFEADMLQAFVDSLPLMSLRYVGDVMPKYEGLLTMNKGSLKVTISPYFVSVYGSLCKSICGNNFITLSHSTIVDALRSVEDVFCIPLSEWIVTRLDVANNFLMDKPTICYMSRFGTLAHYKHLPMSDNGVYYKQTSREVNIYDKIADAKHKRQGIPPNFCDRNVLRIELRAKRGKRSVKETFKLPAPMTAAMLCDLAFYAAVIVDGYVNLLKSINYVNDMEINLNHLTTLKEVDRMGRAALIEKAGGINEMLQLIDRRRSEGAITRKQASDLRRTFKAISNHDEVLLPNADVAELQAKIEATPYSVLPPQ